MDPGTKALKAFNFANLEGNSYDGHFTGRAARPRRRCSAAGSRPRSRPGQQRHQPGQLPARRHHLRGPNHRPIRCIASACVKLGDIINASPVYVKKSTLKYTDTGYSTFAAGTATRTRRAVRGRQRRHAARVRCRPRAARLGLRAVVRDARTCTDWPTTTTATKHRFFVDGSPVVADIYTGDALEDHPGGRPERGRQGYYALDITDPTIRRAVGVHRTRTWASPTATR